jgi:hypothetical protein
MRSVSAGLVCVKLCSDTIYFTGRSVLRAQVLGSLVKHSGNSQKPTTTWLWLRNFGCAPCRQGSPPGAALTVSQIWASATPRLPA